MRGPWLLKASALLLGPALVWASQAENSGLKRDVDWLQSAFITIEPTPLDPAEQLEPLFLDLVLGGIEQDALVLVHRHSLPVTPKDPKFECRKTRPGLGLANDASGRDGSFSIGWLYDSLPLAQSGSTTLLISIDSVNGIPVHPIDFAVNYNVDLESRKTEFLSIHGVKHRLLTIKDRLDSNRRVKPFSEDDYPAFDGEKAPPATEFYSEEGIQLKNEALNNEFHGRNSCRADSLSEPSKITNEEPNHPTSPEEPVAENSEGETYTTPPTPDQREHPLATTIEEPVPSTAPSSPKTAFSEKLSSLLQDQDLVTVLGAAAVFFGFLSLLCISFLHRRLLQKSEEDNNYHRRQWWHSRRHRRHETVFERLARRANRRHARVEAAKAWLRCFFRGLFAGHEEKEETSQQRRPQQQQRQRLRPQRNYPHLIETVVAEPQPPAITPDEEQTTMEQELAQFRAAASMVGDLIAAEEGRSRRSAAPVPAAPRPRGRVSMESEVSDCDTLPTYEESAPAGSVISDGFGFMPGSSAVAPSSSLDAGLSQSNNSDRLGYDK